MGTPFDEPIDLFLIRIKDYSLDNLYKISAYDFEAYTDGILIASLSDFDNCTKDLEDYNSTSREFNITLDAKEKSIISKLMVITWFDKEINNVTQFNLHLNDADFKHYAESQNLKEKSERVDRLREKVSQDMVDYGIKHIPWESWAAGDFSGS